MASGNKRAVDNQASESLNFPSQKAGLPPGSLVHVGNIHIEQPTITVISYCKDAVQETEVSSIEEILQYKSEGKVCWVIVESLADVAVIEKIGELFDIHQLVLEDILNTHQRPKFEEYDDYLYIVLKGLTAESGQFTVAYEQISLLVMKHFVFAFKEKKDDLFAPVFHRIRTSKGRFRSLGTDFLTYSILDAIIDQNHFLVHEDVLE